jgi:hypothetical protein
MMAPMSSASLSNPPSFRTDCDAARAGFFEHGLHIEADLVPDDVCDRVIARAHEMPNAQDGTFRPIPMPHRVDPVFMDMLRFRPIVAIVEAIVGGKVSGLGGDFSYMRPDTPGWLAHQDNLYIQAPPDKLVSVWTALCDIGPENGGLIFYPGSHKLGELPIERLTPTVHSGQNRSAEAIRAVMPPGLEPFQPSVKKGTSFFFHSLLVHGSNANATQDRFRYSLLTTYIGVGQPFRPGTMQRRTEVDLYAEASAAGEQAPASAT